MIWLLAPLFGLIRRFYGANKGDFPLNRLLGYAQTIAGLVYIIFPLHSGVLLDVGYFLLLTAAFWGGMSLVDYDNYWWFKSLKDWGMMALNGLLLTLPAGAILFTAYSWQSAVICGLSGVLMAPGYRLGLLMPTLNKKYLNQGPEWGEFLGHTLIGLVFIFAQHFKNGG